MRTTHDEHTAPARGPRPTNPFTKRMSSAA